MFVLAGIKDSVAFEIVIVVEFLPSVTLVELGIPTIVIVLHDNFHMSFQRIVNLQKIYRYLSSYILVVEAQF